MGIRVSIRIINPHNNRSIITSGLLNSGYESREPEITIPKKLAEQLGYYPLPNNARIITVRTSGGLVTEIFIPKAARMELLDQENNVLREMQVDVSISEMENEVLLSDVTIDELNIEIISFGRGEWRLRGEKIVRKSTPPQTW